MYVSKIILEKIRQRFTLYHTEYRREKSALKAQARTDSVVPRHRGVDVAHRHKQDKVGDVQLCPGPHAAQGGNENSLIQNHKFA